MLNKFLFSIFCIFTFVFVYSQNENGKLYVFTIGISDYSNTNGCIDLPNSTIDSDSVQSVLKKKYGAEIYRPLRNENATRKNIFARLNQLSKDINENDKLLIWYSGHGEYIPAKNKGYWITSNVSSNKELSDAISYNDILALLEDIKAKHILLISDACFSGALFSTLRGNNNPNFTLTQRMHKQSRYALTSGGLTSVFDGERKGSHSPFVKGLLELLNSNEQMYLSSEEIGNYLENVVPINSVKVTNKDKNEEYQIPQKGRLKGDYGGLFTLYNHKGVNNINSTIGIPVSTPTNSKRLRVGVVNYKGKDALETTFGNFTNYIGEQIDRTPYLEIVDYENLAERLNTGEFDFGVFSPFAYIEAKKKYPNLEIFGIHEAKGRIGYYGVILTKKESDIKSLKDLEGKKFLFAHSRSTSGYQYPIKYFRENGIEPNSDFFNYSFSGSHSKSIKALINGEVDAIATYKEAFYDYEKTHTLDDFKIIYESKIIPYNAYVFSPNLDEKTKNSIKNTMFNAHNYSENEQMFNNGLKINRWLPCEDAFYNPLRDYLSISREKKGFDIIIEGIDDNKIKNKFKNILISELEFSNRFDVRQKKGSVNHLLKITFREIDDNNFNYYIYFNNKPLSKGKSMMSDLDDFSILITETILIELPIETAIDFDGKVASIPFGTDDGINNKYKLYIYNKDGDIVAELSCSSLKIRQPNTLLPTSYSSSKSNGLKVLIRYSKE